MISACALCRNPARLAALGLLLSGPVAALVPRGLAPLAVITAVLVAAARVAQEGRAALPVVRRGLGAVLVLFILLAAASVAWSLNPGRSVAAAAGIAYLFLPGLLLLALPGMMTPEDRHRAASALLLGYGLGLGFLVLQLVLDAELVPLLLHRPQRGDHLTARAVGRPEAFLSLLVWPAALVLWTRLEQWRPAWRWGALALPLLHVGVGLTTWHRTTPVATGIAFVVLLLTVWRPRFVHGLLVGLVVLGFAGAVPMARNLEAMGLHQQEWIAWSARHRFEIWQFTADRVLERPLLGHGIDASGSIGNHGQVSRYQGDAEATIIPLHPHNLLLQVWVELGVPGVVLVGLFFLGVLGRVKAVGERNPGRRPFLYATLAAGIILDAVSFGAWQVWWLGSQVLAALALLTAATDGAAVPSSHSDTEDADDADRNRDHAAG